MMEQQWSRTEAETKKKRSMKGNLIVSRFLFSDFDVSVRACVSVCKLLKDRHSKALSLSLPSPLPSNWLHSLSHRKTLLKFFVRTNTHMCTISNNKPMVYQSQNRVFCLIFFRWCTTGNFILTEFADFLLLFRCCALSFSYFPKITTTNSRRNEIRFDCIYTYSWQSFLKR